MDKTRKRDMKLSDYHISNAKYNELKYFCMQYGEKKRRLGQSYGLRAVVSDGLLRGNLPDSPTENAVVQNTVLKEEVDLIERTAREADPAIYKWLLKNVTEGIGYQYLDVPLSRNRFYDSRKYFFYLLAQKR